MPEDANKNTTDGPSLSDCQDLIARIDGTIAALERERILLERRANALSKAPAEQRRAG
ncbi:MAG: hypothetical protein WD690_07955 [Vicinamibacterales bacterium]